MHFTTDAVDDMIPDIRAYAMYVLQYHYMQFIIPSEISRVTSTIEDAGFEVYLVGGCVRDLLIGRVPKDWDLTTNARPEQIQAAFGEDETFYENDFGTVGIKIKREESEDEDEVVEVTPYRTEGKYTDARRPDDIQFSDNLEDDLKRRDFTMNAVAYNVTYGTLVDPYGGQEDINKKTIRAVGVATERFAEDALRMMRAVRLAAELDFTIEAATMTAMAENAELLQKISRERVKDELKRIIMSPSPLQALAVSQKIGLLQYILPELEEGIGCTQGGAHSFDVFEHNLRSLQHAADKDYPLEVRLAALLHDVGKPKSRREGVNKPTFYGHEVVGARMTKKIMKDLRFSKSVAYKVERLVRWHMFFADPDKVTLSAARRMIARVGEENIWDLLNLRICDRIGTGRPKEQPFRFRKYKSMVEEALRSPVSVGQLKIDGVEVMRVTGEKPGARIGWILHALLEEVLDKPEKNTEEYLLGRVKELSLLQDDELRQLGEQGKERQEEEDEKEVQKLREKYHVS